MNYKPMPVTDFYEKLKPNVSFEKIESNDAPSEEVINLIVKTVNDYSKSAFVKLVRDKLSYGKPSKEEFIKRVFDYVCSQVEYLRDPAGHEIIFTPQLLIKRGKGDCKKFSTFIASVLKSADIEPVLKVVTYAGRDWEHIYIIVKTDPSNYLVLDPVNDCKYNSEVKHLRAQEYYLNGKKSGFIMGNKLSQMGNIPEVTNGIRLSTSNILNNAQFVGDRLTGGVGCCMGNTDYLQYLTGIGGEGDQTVIHDLVYGVEAPPFVPEPDPIQLYPYFIGMGLDFLKMIIGNGSNNLPSTHIYIDVPDHNAGTGQYFIVKDGKRVNYMFSMILQARPFGNFQPGTGQSTLIYVGEAAKAQAATFVQQGKATLWDKVKAVVKKVEQIIKDIAHVAAAGQFVIQRAAFLGLLKLGKALENTPLKMHLGQKMAILWTKDNNKVKEWWKAFGGDPAVLGKVILESAGSGVHGVRMAGVGDVGAVTAAAAGEAIISALPVLLSALKMLVDKGIISKSQADAINKGATVAITTFPPSKNTGAPTGAGENPIVKGGAESNDAGMPNGTLPTPTAGSTINFSQPFALNTWFKAWFLFGLYASFTHNKPAQVFACASLVILFTLSIKKIKSLLKN